MIMYAELTTIRRTDRRLGVLSVEVIAFAQAGTCVGVAPALSCDTIREHRK
jgi:hypothetical protein